MNDISQQINQAVTNLVEKYNEVVNGTLSANDFYEQYSRYRMLDIANTIERLENPRAKPILTDNQDGIYMGIRIEHIDYLAVVPRFSLIVTPVHYNIGAIKEFFECRNYRPNYQFRRIKLIKPVFLIVVSRPDKWQILRLPSGEDRLGIIELQQPEPY